MVALHRLTLEDPYRGLQLVGTVAFAVSGAAVAIRVGMDWLGVAVLAVVTAAGGGTLLGEAARWAGVVITLVLRLLAIRFPGRCRRSRLRPQTIPARRLRNSRR